MKLGSCGSGDYASVSKNARYLYVIFYHVLGNYRSDHYVYKDVDSSNKVDQVDLLTVECIALRKKASPSFTSVRLKTLAKPTLRRVNNSGTESCTDLRLGQEVYLKHSEVWEVMEDVLYPDNPKREVRVVELGTDIGTLINDLANDAVEIKSLLDHLDKKLREMYSKIEVDVPSGFTNPKKIDYKGWVVDVVETLEPLVFFKPAEMAIKQAAVMWLRRSGRIGEAAFYDAVTIIGLDSLSWIKIGVEAGAIAAVVGLDLIIVGIAGDKKRSKLRDAIQKSIQARIKLKKAAMINGRVREKLETVVGICDTLKELGCTKEQLDQAQAKVADEFKEEVSKITEETAKQALADLDKHRGSWTKEDH